MPHPLIILGAGASHDYSRLVSKKIPMTNDLIDATYLHWHTSFHDKYRDAADLLSEFFNQTKIKATSSFEEMLTAMRAAHGRDTHRQQQLIDLRFYLSSLFGYYSNEDYESVNNYGPLLSLVRDAGGKACVVSFNYDTVFEKALWKNGLPKDLGSYTAGAIKLVKPHGSHDWVYIDEKMLLDKEKDGDSRTFLRGNLEYFNNLEHSRENAIHHVMEVQGRKVFHCPAIALPLSEKQSFTCPSMMIDVLKEQLAFVDRILIIGWRARDSALLELLREILGKKAIPAGVISGSLEGCEEVVQQLSSNIPFVEITLRHSGFSSFVGSSVMPEFLGVN